MAENDKEHRDGEPLASAPLHLAVIWDDNDPELRLIKAVNALFACCDSDEAAARGEWLDDAAKRRVAAYMLARWGK